MKRMIQRLVSRQPVATGQAIEVSKASSMQHVQARMLPLPAGTQLREVRKVVDTSAQLVVPQPSGIVVNPKPVFNIFPLYLCDYGGPRLMLSTYVCEKCHEIWHLNTAPKYGYCQVVPRAAARKYDRETKRMIRDRDRGRATERVQEPRSCEGIIHRDEDAYAAMELFKAHDPDGYSQLHKLWAAAVEEQDGGWTWKPKVSRLKRHPKQNAPALVAVQPQVQLLGHTPHRDPAHEPLAIEPCKLALGPGSKS